MGAIIRIELPFVANNARRRLDRFATSLPVMLLALLAACAPSTPATPTAETALLPTEVAPVTPLPSPGAACPAFVEEALEAVDTHCATTGRNEVCYGNLSIQAEAQQGVSDFRFESPGDIAELTAIRALTLRPLDLASQEWGVALMRLQANISDSLPGQNVTFLLFGDVHVENAESTEDESSSIQSFYFRTGVGDAPCAEAPDSGILVQTPEGVGTISFRVNEVDVELASTAFLQAQAQHEMKINVLEGQGSVTSAGVTKIVPAGTVSSVPLDASGAASGPPADPQPYEATTLQRLPLARLERAVGITRLIIASSFRNDAEGWTVSGGASPLTHFPADSSSDGYICADDSAEESDWYFQAPASWLGNHAEAYGGSLNFALKQSDSADQYDAPDLFLTGGGITLAYDTSTNPGTDWTSYTVSLNENVGWLNTGTNAAATQQEMQTVLTALSDLRIRGEYRLGADTGCLESVQLTGSLEPLIQRTPVGEVGGQVQQPTPLPTSPTVGVQIGFQISDSIAVASEVDTYTFDAPPGQVVYFDSQEDDSTGNLRWRVVDESETAVFDDALLMEFTDPGVFALERGGTYTISVYGFRDTTGLYQFQVWDVPAPQEFNIGIGDVVSEDTPGIGAGNIESPGVQDVHTFAAQPGQVVYFDSQGDSSGVGGLRWRVADDNRTAVFENSNLLEYTDPGAFTLERGGTYTVTVYGDGDTTGSYQLQLWEVPAPQEFSIDIGDAVSDGVPGAGAGNIETPGVEDIYTFTARAGQVVYFDSQGDNSGEGGLRWRVVDESDTAVFDDAYLLEYIDPGTLTLERGGTYTVTVYGDGDAVGTYQLQITDVESQEGLNIRIGETVSDGVPAAGAGNIETAGAQDVYTFSARAGQTVYFDALPGGQYYLRWRLTDEASNVLFDNEPLDRDTVGALTLERGGTYTITAYGDADTVGPYAFKLWEVLEPQAFDIEIGDAVSDGVPGAGAGNIETPGVQDVYSFTARAGTPVFFDVMDGGQYYLRWQLTDDAGTVIFENEPLDRDTVNAVTLERGGTYTITVYGDAETVGPYAFQLWEVPAPEEFSIKLGDTVTDGVPAAGAGNVETPGAQDVYTFSARAGQVISFRAQPGDYYLKWRLTDETGTVIFENEPLDRDVGEFTLEQGGTYTITSYGEGGTTGTYQFQLVVEVEPATPIGAIQGQVRPTATPRR